jgi:hypothetical protein
MEQNIHTLNRALVSYGSNLIESSSHKLPWLLHSLLPIIGPALVDNLVAVAGVLVLLEAYLYDCSTDMSRYNRADPSQQDDSNLYSSGASAAMSHGVLNRRGCRLGINDRMHTHKHRGMQQHGHVPRFGDRTILEG